MKRITVGIVLIMLVGLAFSQTTKPWDQMTQAERLAATIATNAKLRAERDAGRVQIADLEAQVAALTAEQARLDAVAHDREVELQAQLAQVTEANLGLAGHVADLEGQVQRLTLIPTEPGWWCRDSDGGFGWYSLWVGTEPTMYQQKWVSPTAPERRMYYQLWPLPGMPVVEPGEQREMQVLVRMKP